MTYGTQAETLSPPILATKALAQSLLSSSKSFKSLSCLVPIALTRHFVGCTAFHSSSSCLTSSSSSHYVIACQSILTVHKASRAIPYEHCWLSISRSGRGYLNTFVFNQLVALWAQQTFSNIVAFNVVYAASVLVVTSWQVHNFRSKPHIIR